MFADADVRILIPQVRRALDPGVASASAASAYSDDMIAAITADAVAELLMIAGPTNFPFTLVTASADTNGWPTEWTTDPVLPPEIKALVATQAAIKQLFGELQDLKTSEKISDGAGSWEWQKSANTLRDKLTTLLKQRDMAIKNAVRVVPALDAFVDLLSVRSPAIAAQIEAQ